MKPFYVLAALLLSLYSGLAAISYATSHDPALVETRYCGEPKRNADSVIIRRSAVRAAFQRAHPCPANGNSEGPCPGWAANHSIPLACGGCDSVSNLEWMRLDAKRIHDSYERKIYGGWIETASCTAVPPGGIQ